MNGFKNTSGKLASLIDDVWAWEEVDDYLAVHGQTRFQRLRSAAGEACSCNGAWRAQAEQALQRNGVALQTFFFAVLRLLRDGRREDVPVMVLMGRFGGEGKSFLVTFAVHVRARAGYSPAKLLSAAGSGEEESGSDGRLVF